MIYKFLSNSFWVILFLSVFALGEQAFAQPSQAGGGTTAAPVKVVAHTTTVKPKPARTKKTVKKTVAKASPKTEIRKDVKTTVAANSVNNSSAKKWNGFVLGDEYTFLNFEAVERPRPVYPPNAKSLNAAGLVQVGIVVDEKGKVISAKARTGHPALHATAEYAAMQAKFNPPRALGKPARLVGFLVYCLGDHPDCN